MSAMKAKGNLILVCLMVVALVGAGCAGRTPNPVAAYQYGDEKKSCGHLRAEISEVEGDIAAKTKACDNTTGANVALGVTGALLFWPALFFMDLSEADQVELEALRKRHNALVRLCVDKDCGYDLKPIDRELAQAKEAEVNDEHIPDF